MKLCHQRTRDTELTSRTTAIAQSDMRAVLRFAADQEAEMGTCDPATGAWLLFALADKNIWVF